MQAQTEAADIGTESERQTLLIAYVLHGLALVSGVSMIAGVVINHLRVADTGSEFIRSHHRWLIRTFWWTLLWSLICFALVFLLVGAVGFVALGIWWLYRVIHGLLNFTERKPMPA